MSGVDPADRLRASEVRADLEYIWPSGIGPRVAEPALLLIDLYPWSAPLEAVRLKKK